MDFIQYECLKCGAGWELLSERDPLDQCPNPECRADDYDRPRRGQNLRVCPVCEEEYPGSVNGHGIPTPCSSRCWGLKKEAEKKANRIGVFT